MTSVERQQRSVTTPDGLVLTARVHARFGTSHHAPTLIFTHDWGLTHACWDAVLARLPTSGLRVVTWDQRGHGGSTLGLNRAELDDLTIHHFGRDLNALIRMLVPPTSPVILVGHSLGGMTVLSYLGMHQQEARARVAGAVLLSTAAVDVRLGQEPTRAKLARKLTGARRHPDESLLRTGSHRGVFFGEGPDPRAVAAVRNQLEAVDPAVLRASYRAFCRADVRGGLDALAQLPVSIVVGAHDNVAPPARSRALTMSLTQARYVTVRGAGHMLPYEAPDRIIAEVLWVVSVARSRIRAAPTVGRQSGPSPLPSGAWGPTTSGNDPHSTDAGDPPSYGALRHPTPRS